MSADHSYGQCKAWRNFDKIFATKQLRPLIYPPKQQAMEVDNAEHDAIGSMVDKNRQALNLPWVEKVRTSRFRLVAALCRRRPLSRRVVLIYYRIQRCSLIIAIHLNNSEPIPSQGNTPLSFCQQRAKQAPSKTQPRALLPSRSSAVL
jgi:hypothetical protein